MYTVVKDKSKIFEALEQIDKEIEEEYSKPNPDGDKITKLLNKKIMIGGKITPQMIY